VQAVEYSRLFPPRRRHDEEAVDALIAESGAGFEIVLAVEVPGCVLGHVDATDDEERERERDKKKY
jgi:hypothetical protein